MIHDASALDLLFIGHSADICVCFCAISTLRYLPVSTGSLFFSSLVIIAAQHVVSAALISTFEIVGQRDSCANCDNPAPARTHHESESENRPHVGVGSFPAIAIFRRTGARCATARLPIQQAASARGSSAAEADVGSVARRKRKERGGDICAAGGRYLPSPMAGSRRARRLEDGGGSGGGRTVRWASSGNSPRKGAQETAILVAAAGAPGSRGRLWAGYIVGALARAHTREIGK